MERYNTTPPDPTEHFPVERHKMPAVWLVTILLVLVLATVAWLLF